MTRARDLSQVLNDVGSISTNDIANGAVTQVKLDPSISLGVRVSSVAYPGDDTAADTAGGQTITINGAGFAATPTVYIDNTIAPSVSFVSSTQITFTTPAKTAGTYNLFVINPDGSTAIHVMGISYSGTPTWTTPAGSLGTQNAAAISVQLIATGDTPLVYSLTSGSTLPAGVTLSSSGLISGTLGTAQTFSFSVDVTDPQYQTTPRSFSLTVSVGEPYFQYVTLLLSGNQPSGVTDTDNKTFKDSSANSFAISRASNTTQGTFTPFSKVNGRWGNYFDGSGDILSVANNTALNLSGADFTVEAWVYRTGDSGAYGEWIIGKRDQANPYTVSWVLIVGTGNKFVFGNGNAPTDVISSTTAQLNTWYHVAVVRTGTTARMYINGVLEATVSGHTITEVNTPVTIGNYPIDNPTFTGYISNLRLVKGVAVYTGNFTSPTAPLAATQSSGINIAAITGTATSLLTCQSNRFIDNSTNAFAITRGGDVAVTTFSPFPTLIAYSTSTNGGSGYFDGSGDYLLAASNAAFALGTGDFTVETFAYYNALTPVDAALIINWDGITWGANKWSLHANHVSYPSKVSFWLNNFNASAPILTSTTTVTVGQWYHIAVSRSGSTFRLFINGALEATATSSTSLDGGNNSPIYVGGGLGSGNTQWFNGYLSSSRLVKGTAVYTGAFTPPTAPISTSGAASASAYPSTTNVNTTFASSNCSLLLNYTNGAIIDSSMANDLETAGNTQISTAQSKWGGSSIYFDGTGDYLLARYNKLFGLLDDQGDFTLEGWFYRTVVGTGQFLLSTMEFTGTYTGWGLVFNNTNTAGFFCYDSGNTPQSLTSTSTVGLNTWAHVAVSRSGGTTRLFVNGVVEATRTVAFANTVTQSPLVFGLRPDFGDSLYTGYMQDVRITFGYARYTANFTPPTGPFIGNGV